MATSQLNHCIRCDELHQPIHGCWGWDTPLAFLAEMCGPDLTSHQSPMASAQHAESGFLCADVWGRLIPWSTGNQTSGNICCQWKHLCRRMTWGLVGLVGSSGPVGTQKPGFCGFFLHWHPGNTVFYLRPWRRLSNLSEGVRITVRS